jgi:hypothetical protein
MRNVLDISCRENQNTHFMFNNFLRNSCRLWDNVEKYRGARGAGNDVTIWYIRVACWISKAIRQRACTCPCSRSPIPHVHTHAPVRALTHRKICNIYCFSMATMIPKRASFLLCTYVAFLVYYLSGSDVYFLQISPRNLLLPDKLRPIPVTERSKARVRGRSVAGITSSYLVGRIHVYILRVFYVVR